MAFDESCSFYVHGTSLNEGSELYTLWNAGRNFLDSLEIVFLFTQKKGEDLHNIDEGNVKKHPKLWKSKPFFLCVHEFKTIRIVQTCFSHI